ncbi:MAG: hypothetical protein HY329_23230 [Chloroflexi bacterium]|nr:hypothetical protein [Chloroflexota bacterium]
MRRFLLVSLLFLLALPTAALADHEGNYFPSPLPVVREISPLFAVSTVGIGGGGPGLNGWASLKPLHGNRTEVTTAIIASVVPGFGFLSGVPGNSHVNHIHYGGCPYFASDPLVRPPLDRPENARQGQILIPLNNVVIGPSGEGLAVTIIPYDAFLLSVQPLYVNAHRGPNLLTPQNALPFNCGDVTVSAGT